MRYSKFSIIFSMLLLIAQMSYSQDQVVMIGSGGGFTGSVTAYKITSRGEVWKGTGVSDIKYTECARLKKKTAKKFIASANKAVETSKGFNHPGNMYSFIATDEHDAQSRITWGDNSNPAPENIRLIYTDIQKAVSNLKYKPVR